MMPHDMLPWPTVYQQSQRWLKAGVFDAIAHDLRALLRLTQGCKAEPQAAIFDSRTLQSLPESGTRAGYDGAKRCRGSKVHMAVDTLGHLLAVHVSAASEQDRIRVTTLAAPRTEACEDRHLLNHAWALAGKALPSFDHAFRSSPRDPLRAGWHVQVFKAHMMLGEDHKVLDESKRAAAANPKSPGAVTLQTAALALLSREDEARAALAVRQQLGPPSLTLTTIKEGTRSDYPEYSRLMERYYEGLRQAGFPE